ncbi:hypothetical protein B0O99DRAFT_511543 [Bisporella sp. PMI_857]|nr:hypothetical protein B0O99DRAFT_511543 [Bisporella sp. PMI_857]
MPPAEGSATTEADDVYPSTFEPLSAMSTFTDEDAELLIGPSMSRAASRLKSPKTPAAEKQIALEEAIGFFETDPETPPADEDGPEREMGFKKTEISTNFVAESLHQAHTSGLSLGNLPPKSEAAKTPDLPITPWHAGPKPLIVPAEGSKSSLQAVFATTRERKRTLSGGADALRKLLPKNLPSMAQVGNYFTTGTSGYIQKGKDSGSASPQRDSDRGVATLSPTSSTYKELARPHSPLFQSTTPPPRYELGKPRSIRRVNSDDSVLYHTLSKASSLGDDSMFENQRVQVNSRTKAIRDSFQDRSSFRIPNMPSLPSLPNFNFNMNFLNNESTAIKPKSEVGTVDKLTSTTRKRTVSLSNPVVAPSIIGAALLSPKTASDNTIPPESPAKFLDRAIEDLTGDVVIMGGYRGSVLRSKKTGRQVWAPVKIGLNIRKVDLEVGLEPEDEERMEETIYPSGMLKNIGPVDISRRLFKRLNATENARTGKLRIWDYGYDWRLSPHLLSRKLTKFLEQLPSNRASGNEKGAIVIAHSLGGLITRHVVNARPELFSGVIYAGVPQSCVNILGPLRNGDAVLLSSRILTAQVNFTLRTSFVLLPEDGACFVDINTKEKYPVDFFDIEDWIKYRLSPCTDPPLPPYSQRSRLVGSLLNLNLSGSVLSLSKSGKKSTGSITPPHTDSNTSSDAGREAYHHTPRTTRAANVMRDAEHGKDRTLAVQMGNSNPVNVSQSTNSSVSTAVTIPRDKAIAYLRRTLVETKQFKQELRFRPEHSESNKYPPFAFIYGKSIPTCCGAKVDGLESIPCSDVYDNLAFAAGDGVCLAKEAMLPPGYQAANGGRIRSERGHVTLLGDLNAVGRALEAVTKGRAKGIGLGK